MRLLLLMTMTLLLLSACTVPQAQARVGGALDVLGKVVEPSYGFATDACALGEESIARAVELGQLTPEQRAREQSALRSRCDHIVNAFARVRELHQLAGEVNRTSPGEAWELVRDMLELVQGMPTARASPPDGGG